jgi:alpha-tubulin suppressor-like RCC1 family protein
MKDADPTIYRNTAGIFNGDTSIEHTNPAYNTSAFGDYNNDGNNTSEDLNGIWMNSESDIFAVGYLGTIIHYNGSDWQSMTSNTIETLNDIHGVSSSNVFAVGNNGTIVHYNASNWSSVTGTTEHLNAVWCESLSSVYAAGDNGSILYYDGSTWTPMTSNTTDALYAIHGTSNSDIYAVGASGRIVHYNGTSWNATTEGTEDFHDVYCVSSSKVYAVGTSGKIYIYNGAVWSEQTSLYDETFYGVWASDLEDIFFVGKSGTILHDAFHLFLTLPENAGESDGILIDEGQIHLSAGYPDPITITLLSDSPSVLTVPTTVIMPSWMTSVTFDLSIINDANLNGPRHVQISAFAAGMQGDLTYIQIYDDDTGNLSIELPTSVNERDGILENAARVTLDTPAVNDITVYLESTDTSRIIVPSVATIPSGLTSVTFHLEIVDNIEITGNESITITATVNDESTSTGDTVLFIDDEDKTLILTLPASVYEDDGINSNGGKISIPGTYYEDVTITLISSDAGGITVVGEIVINAYETEESFDLNIVDDLIKDGTQMVHITASAAGWTSVTETISVLDNELKWAFQSPIPQANNLNAVWKNHDNDIFAVGEYGAIAHFDGHSWVSMESNTHYSLYDVWGNSSTDVYAVGEYGVVVHYDGNQWSLMDSGKSVYLYGIWGDDNQELFVVGGGWNGSSNEGTVLHYTGTTWNAMDSGTTETLKGLWGTSASDIYAVGNSGTIIHFDGTTWNPMTSNTSYTLNAVWGTSQTDIYAVGNSGVIAHYDGNIWSELSSVTTDTLNDIWGAPGLLIAVGGGYHGGSSEMATIVIFDGVEWTESMPDYPSLKGISGVDTNDMWGVGQYGIILNYQNNSWSDLGIPTLQTIYDIFELSTDELIAVGDSGSIIHYTNHTWTAMESPTSKDLLGVWGSSINDIYAVGGDSNYGVVIHYDGNAWTEMDSGILEKIKAIWGSSSTDIFAVGYSGGIFHYAGSDWSEMTDTSTEFNDIWGSASNDVYAVNGMSLSGKIYHYDGSSWALIETLSSGIQCVWGTSSTNIFAAGSESGQPAIYNYDGSSWSEMESGTSGEIRDIHGNSANKIYAAASSGAVYYYNGSQWSQLKTGASSTSGLYAINCSENNHVFAAGQYGTILHYQPELIISIPLQAVENDGTLSNQGLVSIEYPRESDLSVSLTSSHSKLVCTSPLVIPAGETSKQFNLEIQDNLFKDGTTPITVTASADDYSNGTAQIVIYDNETETLTVSMPDSVTEGQGKISGLASVSVASAAGTDILVPLQTSDSSEILVPDQVIILSGQNSQAFDFTVVSDMIIDGNQTAIISATISGWNSVPDAITVVDLVDKSIIVTLPERGIEGDGVLAEKGIVTLASVQPNDVTLTITNSDASQISVTTTVVIPKGWLSAGFDIEIIDDATTDGAVPVSLTITGAGWSDGNDSLSVQDNEKGVVQFSSDLFTTTEDAGVITITITRTYATDGTVTVDYTTSDGTATSGSDYIPVSGTIVMNDSQSSQSFTVTINDDTDVEGIETIIVTLSNPGNGVSIGIPNPATISITEVNYMTEQFDDSDFDLENTTLIFTPDGSESYYEISQQSATSFPVDPTGSTQLSIGNWSYLEVNVSDSKKVYFYGTGYSRFYVADNGYINFGSGDSSSTQSFSDFFSKRRIAPLFADLNPAGAGISWKQLDDRVVVTYQEVPDGSSSGANSFQVEMFFDGTIRITYLNVDITNCICGFSKGQGVASGFYETDFSETPVMVSAPILTSLSDLTMNEDTVSNTLSFTVTDDTSQSLTISYISSNQSLISSSGISFSGAQVSFDANTYTVAASSVGAFVSLTIIPAMNQSGIAQITITVTNPNGLTASESFSITVNAIDDPPQISQIISVASGSGHHLALKADGTVYAWGKNDYGQLGNGNTTEQHTPVPVQGLTNVKAVFAGNDHSMALKHDGTLWAWGYNAYGQLGDGSTEDRYTPVQVSGINSVIDVSLGVIHSLAVKADKTAWAWGRNSFGRLGIDAGADQLVPAQIKGVNGTGFLTNIIQVAAGDMHSMALAANGNVFAWGNNDYNQLGNGVSGSGGSKSYPALIDTLSNVKEIGVGKYHSVALKHDGSVWTWGKKEWLGAGTLSVNQNLPIQVLDNTGTGYLSNVMDIAIGEEHNLAILSDRTVWAWGRNGAGRLGDGTTSDRNTPIQIEDYDGTTKLSNILSFDGGTNNTIIAKPDGTIWTCGNNLNGRIGDNTTTERHNITQVHGRRNIDNFNANVINQTEVTKSIHLIVADPDANNVTITAMSSDNAILPYTNIVLCDSGTNACMLTTTVMRSSDIPIEITSNTTYGMITITIQAIDSTGLTSSYALPLRVNSAPTIAGLEDLSIMTNASDSIAFSISDNETSDLVLTKESSDLSLVSLDNIVISGTGASRTLSITPTANQSGTVSITISVIDGDIRITESFSLTILSLYTENTDISLTDVGSGSAVFGDYDNDGDLDILITGNDGTNKIAKIYNNTEGSFSEAVGISIIGVYHSSAAFGDYDNDGDLDLLLSGSTGSAKIAKLYRNTGGNFTEETNFTGVEYGTMTFGDYDNDGDQDILITGQTESNRIAKVFQNTEGSFSEDTTITLTDVYNGSGAFGDYDNDGDLDILITGDNGSFNVAKVYQNTGGDFTVDTSISLTGISSSSAAFGDYDNDGDLDLLIAGNTGSSYMTSLFQNTEGNFNEVTELALPDVYNSPVVAFGDYDNDGDLDILITGQTDTSRVAKVFQNSEGNFSEDLSILLPGVSSSAAAFGDYDNDGDLDILITGFTGTEKISKIFTNHSTQSNTAPSAPSTVTSIVSGENVLLSWSAGSDAETISPAGLNYNLRIGSTPGGNDILAPMALPLSNGYRLIPARGIFQNLTATYLLSEGTYYWSVQTIDTAFAGSEFTAESTFEIAISPVISEIPNQSTNQNTPVSSIAFQITDTGSAPCSINLTITSSNTP